MISRLFMSIIVIPLLFNNGLPREAYGTVIGQAIGQPDQLVRLAEVWCDNNDYSGNSDCAWVLDTARAPADCSDANGYFAINDVEQFHYVVVVGMPENNDYYVLYRDHSDIMWVQEGTVYDVGSFYAYTYETYCPSTTGIAKFSEKLEIWR